MKHTTILIFLLFSLLTNLQLFGQVSQFDSLSYLSTAGASVKIKGQTKQLYNRKLDSAFVKVYSGQKLVFSQFYPKGRFEIFLPLNSKLTIEISRNKYYAKRITVDTNLPEKEDKPYLLIFDFIMIEKKLLEGLDDFILDFPTGLISYDSKKGFFTYAERYTKQILKDVLKLIEAGEKRQLEQMASQRKNK